MDRWSFASFHPLTIKHAAILDVTVRLAAFFAVKHDLLLCLFLVFATEGSRDLVIVVLLVLLRQLEFVEKVSVIDVSCCFDNWRRCQRQTSRRRLQDLA